MQDGSLAEACVYIWKDEYQHLVEAEVPWHYEEWRRAHLDKWVSRCESMVPWPGQPAL